MLTTQLLSRLFSVANNARLTVSTNTIFLACEFTIALVRPRFPVHASIHASVRTPLRLFLRPPVRIGRSPGRSHSCSSIKTQARPTTHSITNSPLRQPVSCTHRLDDRSTACPTDPSLVTPPSNVCNDKTTRDYNSTSSFDTLTKANRSGFLRFLHKCNPHC